MDKLEIMVRLACADTHETGGVMVTRCVDDSYMNEAMRIYGKAADALIEAAGKSEEVPTKGTEIEAWAVINRDGDLVDSFGTPSHANDAAEMFDKRVGWRPPHRVVRLTGRVE